MKRFLFYMTFLGLMLPNMAFGLSERERLDEQSVKKSQELVSKAQTGKDGAFEVMSEFAECSGFYEASSEYSREIDGGEALGENLKGYANGARLVAWYFWRAFSNKPMLAVEGVQGAAKLRYAALLEAEGPDGVGFIATMEACNANLELQALVIKEIRKSY